MMKTSATLETVRPVQVVGGVAVAYLVFVVVRLALLGYDPSAFVVAGAISTDPRETPTPVRVVVEDGYDGQFFYRLALNPFTTQRTELGVTMDNPPYRQQRILYPFVVWLLSLGRPEAVPTLMIAVNYASLCVLGWFSARLFQSFGHAPIWGVAVVIYPGLLISLSRDLAEVMEACLLVGSLVMLRQARAWAATALLSAAVLTRETATLVPVAMLLASVMSWLRGERQRVVKWYVIAVPLSLGAVWQAILLAIWRESAQLSTSYHIGVPFGGILPLAASTLKFETFSDWLWFSELCFFLALSIWVVMAWQTSQTDLFYKVAWLCYGLLNVFLTTQVWADDNAYLRTMLEFYLFGSIVLVTSSVGMKPLIFAWAAALWMVLLTTRIVEVGAIPLRFALPLAALAAAAMFFAVRRLDVGRGTDAQRAAMRA
jgi:hypothetical protein